MTLTLPYPPTLNTYWRNVRGKTLISRDGRAYRRTVCDLALFHGVTLHEGRLDVAVVVHPPDKRRRDLDNLTKALLDALEHAGAYQDDSQIDRLLIERGERREGGCVVVRISEMGDNK